MDSHALFEVFVFLAAACVAVPLTSRFKLGSVLGYLVAGVLIGPYAFGLIGNPEEIMHFAEFGVVMMLFLIGLELAPAKLWRMRKTILGLGGLQVVLTLIAITALGRLAGYDWSSSIAVGMALSLSSTALVLQMLQEKKLLNTKVGETSFSVLLFQDIAVIPMLILMPLLAGTSAVDPTMAESEPWVRSLAGWEHALLVAAVIGGVVLAGNVLARPIFRIIARTNLREVFTATSLALVVGITLLMLQVGVSPALGAFIAGVVLANSEYRHTLEANIEPFKGLLLGLFFISVGMGADFGLLAEKPIRLIAAVLALASIKILIIYGLTKLFKHPSAPAIGATLALAQGGEFAFVLFQYADSLSILKKSQMDFLTMVVALSMAFSPVLMLFYTYVVVPRANKPAGDVDYDTVTEKSPVILAGYGRFGQIVGRYLTANGIAVTVLEKSPDQIEMLRKFGHKGFFGDASRLDLLRSAGVEEAKMLIVAVDDPDACLDIARMAREHFPDLTIYSRARNRRHAYELHKAGVSYFRRETFDSALNMAQKAAIELGFDEEKAARRAEKFRQHDEEALEKSYEFFEEERTMASFSRQASGELERILKEDEAEDQRQTTVKKGISASEQLG